MTKKLFDLALDESFETYVLIKAADVRTAKNGKPFIAFTFQDRSGQMDGKYWSATEQEIQRFATGTVVFLSGKREVYNGSPQIKILQLRVASLEKGEPASPDLYLERAPESRESLEESLSQAIFDITEPDLRRIVHHILGKYKEPFFEYPAAKRHHHAFTGGLSYHTVSMLRLAQAILQLYPQLNKSLLLAGVILHDIGKTLELTGPVGTEYTLKGNLMGHIVLMDEEITLACRDLGIDQESQAVILLKHMVLSHHGLLEYGSPVRPSILEAQVLHQIDMMDASITMISTALDKAEVDGYTDRIFGMDNRSYFKHHLQG